MARRRGSKVSIAFMIVWIVLWTAGIFAMIYLLGGAALEGNITAVVVIGVWLVAAGFALYAAGQNLRSLLLDGRKPPRALPNHEWDDDMPDRRNR